jgi:hypothetical protein
MSGCLGIACYNLFGPGGSLIDPGPQDSNFAAGETLALGRHDNSFFVHAGDKLHQAAFCTLAGLNGRSRFSAHQSRLPLIEPQSRLLQILTVASKAVFDQQWLDVRGEVDCAGRRRRQCPGGPFRADCK